MDNKQIDAKILLLYFNNSGVAEATVNIPFLVTDILFKPPVSVLVQNLTMSFIITSTMVNAACQTMSGYNSITMANDFRHRFQKPESIRGSYTFSFFQISNGAPAAFTGGVAFPIEFIGYNKH